MRNYAHIPAIAASALMASGMLVQQEGDDIMRRQPDPAPAKPKKPRQAMRPFKRNTFLKPFDPAINRHTGEPHAHSREIARRARQAAKRRGVA